MERRERMERVNGWATRTALSFLIVGLGLPVLCAADDKDTPASPSSASLSTNPNNPTKMPTFTGYTFVGDAVGEVVKTDGKSLTMRITWFVPQIKNVPNHRPQFHNTHYHHRNPYAPNMNRPANTPQVTFKEQHHDYVIDFLPESMIRTKVLPPKMDEKGKRVIYTTQELQDLKGKSGAAGYAGSADLLVPGTIVEVVTVRDKTIPADKLNERDMKIKTVLILGTDPNPPKDIANGTAGNPPPKPPKKN